VAKIRNSRFLDSLLLILKPIDENKNSAAKSGNFRLNFEPMVDGEFCYMQLIILLGIR
jgi:hypothetical protein